MGVVLDRRCGRCIVLEWTTVDRYSGCFAAEGCDRERQKCFFSTERVDDRLVMNGSGQNSVACYPGGSVVRALSLLGFRPVCGPQTCSNLRVRELVGRLNHKPCYLRINIDVLFGPLQA